MHFSAITLLTAGLASMAAAFTTPVGEPTGNPILTPSLGEVVAAGAPYTIKWKVR